MRSIASTESTHTALVILSPLHSCLDIRLIAFTVTPAGRARRRAAVTLSPMQLWH